MYDLISIDYSNEKFPVKGRDLHFALQIKTRYNDWFSRMCEYGFIEGRDFYLKMSKPSNVGGRPSLDHEISIRMAEEICMLQRNELGKKFREYFIKIAEEWNSDDRVVARAQRILQDRVEEARIRISYLEAAKDVLETALNCNLEWWTVNKYNALKEMNWSSVQCQKVGKMMSKYCRENGYEIRICKTNDDRFPTTNSYPLVAWEKVMSGIEDFGLLAPPALKLADIG